MFKLVDFIILVLASIIVLNMKGRNRKFEVITGSCYLFTFIFNILFTYITTGWKGVFATGLPLFHCSVGMIIQMYYMLTDKEPGILLKHANCIAVGGTIFALFISNMVYENPLVFTVSSTCHILFTLISLYCVKIRNIRLEKHEYKYCVITIIIYNITLFIINMIFDTNYSNVYKSPFNFYVHPLLVLLMATAVFFVFYIIDYIFVCKKEEGGNI